MDSLLDIFLRSLILSFFRYRTFYTQENLINPTLKINNLSMYSYKQNLPYNLIFVNEVIFFS